MTGTSFLLAPGSGPQDYATRRAMIQAMMPQFGKASTIGEGLGQLFTGIGLGRQQKALDAEEAAARQSAMAGFDGLMSRGGTAQPGGMSINGPIPFTPPAPTERPDPNSPQGIGLDAMAALGHVSPYGHGIASVESAGSGGYSAIGPDTGKGRAYGKYQVMDFNIPDWTLKHTGKRMTPEEFLASPGAQEAVFNGEFGSYVQKYGNPQDAASVWFSGRPMAGNNSSDGYTTVPEYVQKFNAGMGSGPSTAELAAAASNPMLTEGQRAMAAQMLAEAQAADERARQQQDPAYVLGLQADQLAVQKSQIELAQMQQPKPGYRVLTGQEAAQMGLPQGVWQMGPDGQIEAVNGGSAAKDPIAELDARARAGGLIPGTPEYQTYMLRNGSVADQGRALSIIWGRDANGNPVPMQASPDGTLVPSKLPEGITPLDPASKSYETALGSGMGKNAADAQNLLPVYENITSVMDQQITDLLSDPYLPDMLGPINSRMPNLSDDAARVQGRLDQLQGGTFLQARQLLKGGGAITDFEGKKAEDAFARMQAAQNPDDFKTALEEFRYFVQQGFVKLQQQAAQNPNQRYSGPTYGAPVTINGYTIEEVK